MRRMKRETVKQEHDFPIWWLVLGEAVAWVLYVVLQRQLNIVDSGARLMLGMVVGTVAVVVVVVVHRLRASGD